MAFETVTEQNHLIGAHMARAAAMMSAIEGICPRLEDADASECFDLTTAIEACVQVARLELGHASAAQEEIKRVLEIKEAA